MSVTVEKRQAGAGERISIVAPYGTGGEYHNGDVLTVTHRELGGVKVEENDMLIADREYVVIREDRTYHQDLSEEIELLKKRVAALERGEA